MGQDLYRFNSSIGCALLTITFLLLVQNAVGGPNWCSSPAICFNTTHLNLCVGYDKGYIYRWENPISCPFNSVCNFSRCEEIYPSPPYIFGMKSCNAYGFTCDGRDKFRLCKYDRNNNSVSFSWNFQCPHNTVCDNNYPYHCRDSGYSISNLPPPPPPPPGFHLPSAPPPVSPVVPTYPPITRDDCKGKDFVCVDSEKYLLCRNMGDGTIRTYPEQFKCPKGSVCHKSFDRPCSGPGSQAPPPPGFHVPPQGPAYPPVTRDDCKGKTFVCLDSKTYLLCRNMGDGTIRTEHEQYKCPKGKACHKSFDRPCAASGAGSYHNFSAFGWGVLSLVLAIRYSKM